MLRQGPFVPSLPAVLSSPATASVLLQRFSSAAAPRPLRSRGGLRPPCGNSGGGAAGTGDGLRGFLGEQVEALLKKEENRALLDGLEEASSRVDAARRALADIQRQEAEAARAKEYILQLQSRQSEIEETQRELLEARSMVEEAERSLSPNMGENTPGDAAEGGEIIDKDLERLESIKAAMISSAVGTLAGVPISAYQATSTTQWVAHLAVIFLSCALFGVTFRYTVRRDLNNTQLKTGTCAAFGFIKGLSTVEAGRGAWEFSGIDGFLQLAADGAIHVSESTFIFLFSAVALDFCFKTRVLSPGPIRK
ncbi:unnamed protein product [Spirodela intermedia]|uniref:Uncharacterized protein n=1 Tax=Spirodela intermedia TaxID=51605 RepID=A0A7I8KQS9_SPIIN|nr:unnamed protein product [Spirodela intermedia]